MATSDPERQPLLSSGPQQTHHAEERIEEESAPFVGEGAPETIQPAEDGKTGRNTWIRYGILFLVGTTALVLLIKGLIESGDVKVCPFGCRNHLCSH
jgi:hypothetical protein